MSSETDLIRMILALQMGFVTRDQVVEAGTAWAEARDKSLFDVLAEKGFLEPDARTALDAMVCARMSRKMDLLETFAECPPEFEPPASTLSPPKNAPEKDHGTILELKSLQSSDREEKTAVIPKPAVQPKQERYRIGNEIGRGALGRVVEATDTVLGRAVAIKEMLKGAANNALLKRFLREGEVAGRLLHLNIVPVFDVGVRPDPMRPGSSGRPYFVMGRIHGRDLREILTAVEQGAWPSSRPKARAPSGPGAEKPPEPPTSDNAHSIFDCTRDPRKDFSRPRLLRLFQDVCLAIAYAHHHGVIHRDLKPANIMVGDFGEVFVVDWGLAKVKGEPEQTHRDGKEPAAETDSGEPFDLKSATLGSWAGQQPDLTVEGDILGTPAYMPPEQAEGSKDKIDEKSDIYSLGAILYEIVTFSQPFEGSSGIAVITKVMISRLVPPSERVAARKSAAYVPEPVPLELDEIVLKAMSRDRDKRYQSVRDLLEDVQQFLEGEKEKERKRADAEENVRRGREHLELFREISRTIETEEKALKEERAKVKPYEPIEAKRPIWDRDAELAEMRKRRMAEFGKADVAFGRAIADDPGNQGGFTGRCELYLEMFFEAEKRHDPASQELYRGLIAEFDRDGRFKSEMDRPGSLSIRTLMRACGCLLAKNRSEFRVEIGTEPAMHWTRGRPKPGEKPGEKSRAIPEIKVSPKGSGYGHARECAATPVAGAKVVIHRFEEKDKRLVPGPGLELGATPLGPVSLDKGSYLCVITHPDFVQIKLPVRIDRGAEWSQEVNLYNSDEIPEGFCCVPGGPFIAGGEKAGYGFEEDEMETDDCFLAAIQVSFADYIEFLDANPHEAASRQPREGDLRFLAEEGGKWRLSEAAEDNPLGLTPTMPVMGVSWFDALAYCSWLSERDGRLYTLPHEDEWEKAAKGVDGRAFPWGGEWDGNFSNTLLTHKEGPRLREPGSFEADESPYGLRDMAGNLFCWCLNTPEKTYWKFRVLRGGAWNQTPDNAKTGHRKGFDPTNTQRNRGIRLCMRAMRLDSPLTKSFVARTSEFGAGKARD